jgi:signal transduction histidine kinase
MKDQFLATVSHELRTPLTAILGWSAILSGTDVDAQMLHEGLATIQRTASVQKKLIEDLLDVSRIQSGKLRLSIQEVQRHLWPDALHAQPAPLRAAAPRNLRHHLYGIIDTNSGTLSIANAGHPPALLRRRDGSIERLQSTGPVAGMLPDAGYRCIDVQLSEGDRAIEHLGEGDVGGVVV